MLTTLNGTMMVDLTSSDYGTTKLDPGNCIGFTVVCNTNSSPRKAAVINLFAGKKLGIA
jgi:hypothetical protein